MCQLYILNIGEDIQTWILSWNVIDIKYLYTLLYIFINICIEHPMNRFL